MLDFDREKKPVTEIGIISMIDVIFMLVIFFLIAGTISKFDIIPVDVPFAKSSRLLQEGDISIVMGRYDEIVLNDKLYLSVEEIRAPLQKLLEENPETVINLKVDSRVDAFRLMNVMDIIKEVGGKNISLITRST